MTVNRGPGVAPIAGVGTTTVEHRLQLAGLYAENAPGVPRSGVLAQATDQLVIGKADMSYDVGPAPLVIGRTAAEGVYTPTLTGTTNVPTGAAPGTNSRWDLIYVKQNDQAKGDADNAAIIGVQQGTAAASPTKPTGSLPAGAYVLAEARIFAGTTGTSGGSNTISQVWRHTAARGAQITIRNATERAEITTPAKGQLILRTDQTQVSPAGTIERWNGAGWDHLGHSEWTFNQTNPAFTSGVQFGSGALTNDSGNTTDTAFVTTSGETLVVRDKGVYDVTLTGTWSDPSTSRAFSQFIDSSSGETYRQSASVDENLCTVTASGIRLAAGAVLTPSTFVIFASGTTTWAGRMRVTRVA